MASLGVLARYFKWPPSEIWEFDIDETDLWLKSMKAQIKAAKQAQKGY